MTYGIGEKRAFHQFNLKLSERPANVKARAAVSVSLTPET